MTVKDHCGTKKFFKIPYFTITILTNSLSETKMTLLISDGKKMDLVMRTELKEKDLQDIIEKHPELIFGEKIKKDLKIIAISREFRSPSGRTDVLAIDQNGEVYIIEVKLLENPESKREVVSQILDYGQAIWKKFKHQENFEEFLVEAGKYTKTKCGMSLEQYLKEQFEITDEQVEELKHSIMRNLSEANFQFVIMMNQLREEFKDLITFLNKFTTFALYAVELAVYDHGDQVIISPKMFGYEAKETSKISSSKRISNTWDEKSFLESAQSKLEQNHFDAFKKLYFTSKEIAEYSDFGKGKSGSFRPRFSKIYDERAPYYFYEDGSIYFPLHYADFENNEKQNKFKYQFKDNLSQIKELEITDDSIGKNWSVSIEKWAPIVDQLIDVIKKSVN